MEIENHYMSSILEKSWPKILVGVIFVILLFFVIWKSNIKEETYDWTSPKDLVLSEDVKKEYEATVDQIKDTDKEDPEALSKLAKLRDSGGDPEGAADLYRKSLKIKPSSEVMASLGDLYGSVGDYKNSEKMYLEIINNNPYDVETYNKLFELYRYKLKDNYREPESWLFLGWQVNPSAKTYFIKRIAAYYKDIGDKDRAVNYYQQILDDDPENPEARAALQEIMNIKF